MYFFFAHNKSVMFAALNSTIVNKV